MLPTLNDEDIVLTTADLTELHRGDIVLFYDPIKPDYIDICRIVGLPNETVEVHEGAVYIDGEYLVEPYVLPENNEKNRHSGKFVLAENTFFLLGDNRDNSKDSRVYGAVPKERIFRKYTRTFWTHG